MTFYVFVNWFFAIISSVLLGWAFFYRRYVFIKPSTWAIVFFHTRIQWTTALSSEYIEYFLPQPWTFVILTHGFVLFGLIGSFGIGNRIAKKIWERIRRPQPVPLRIHNRSIFLLIVYFVIFLPIYFYYVPLSTTGLYAIFTNPENAQSAREYSLKLVNSGLIRYGHNIMINVIATLLSGLLAQSVIQYIKHKQYLRVLMTLIPLGILVIVVSVAGARSNGARLLLIMIFAVFLYYGLKFNPFYIGITVLVVLTFPTILTILREGAALTWPNFWRYLDVYIFNRLFDVTMNVGLWHVQYAQINGFFGIQGISKLATFFGEEPIVVPNLIGLYYGNTTLQTIMANTSFVYAYYAYFGLISFPISVLLIWSLDLTLWVSQKLTDNMLLPYVAASSMIASVFIGAEFTTALISNGFLILLIAALMIDHLAGEKNTIRHKAILTNNSVPKNLDPGISVK